MHEDSFNNHMSSCNGNKKAVLVGINYFGSDAQLRGCINDVNNVRAFIRDNYQFSENKMWILTDDQQNQRNLPTKKNIIDAMHWLIKDAKENDSLFFHFSGHGSQTEDLDGDEEDGYDETILPLDYLESGQIIDDEINNILVKNLPHGARLTAVFDSCHSGSVMDLPYLYDHYGNLKAYNPEKVVLKSAIDIGKKYLLGDKMGAISALKDGFNNLTKGTKADKISKETRTSKADVVMFSGCKDNQTSADTKVENECTGAMSHALISALTKSPFGYSYIELLNEVRSTLREKYSQKSQLSSGREMDMNLKFIM